MTLTLEDANRILDEVQTESMKNPSHNWTELYIDDHPCAPFRRLVMAKEYFADGSIGEYTIADVPASLPGDGGNARLLSAAYNAFDSAARVLGCNAVELAERAQDGELAELIEAAVEFLHDGDLGFWKTDQGHNSEERFRAALAKVKGGAYES